MAVNRAGNNMVRLALEQVRESVRIAVWCDPKDRSKQTREKLSNGDGSVDVFFSDLHPKLRNLCTMAFGELHNATDDEVSSFKASRKVVAAG
jgi:hypothetical protein